MFCSACGKKATGKFCWNCGAALHAEGDAAESPLMTVAVPVDWKNEVEYATVVKVPQVRDLLAKQIPPGAALSGEALAEAFGKIVSTPLPVVPAMKIAQEINSRLGIGTGKTRVEQFRRPVGWILASVVCALAKEGYKIQDVRQASDGCTLICEIPSDMFTLAGQLVVTVQREAEGASVHAATSIKGQLFDWGKSKRGLDGLMSDVESLSKSFL